MGFPHLIFQLLPSHLAIWASQGIIFPYLATFRAFNNFVVDTIFECYQVHGSFLSML